MSDIDQATVNTYIPHALVTEADKAVLAQFGYQSEDAGTDGLYFFMPEEKQPMPDGGELAALKDAIEQSYPDKKTRPEWTEGVFFALKEQGQEPFASLGDYVEAEEIFQAMLRKPENRGPGQITEIEIMGCYHHTGGKMPMNTFGGWVMLITADNVLSESTLNMAFKLRETIRHKRVAG